MLDNMKVATKLGAGFAVVVSLAMLQAGYSWLSVRSLSSDITLLAEDRMAKVDQLSAVKDNANVVARAIRNMVLLKEPAEVEVEKKRVDQSLARNEELTRALIASVHSSDSVAALAKVDETAGPYNASIAKVSELASADKDAEATAMLLKDVRPLQAAYFKALDGASDLQRSLASGLARQARANAETAALFLALLTLGAAFIGAVVAWLISRGLTRQLGGEPGLVVAVANAIAEGDLRQEVELRQGDTTSIAAAMRRMNDKLAQIVDRVRNSSDSIATGSAEIATGNADLSQRTEEQASNLQQTAASMEQLASTVKANADTTQQANAMSAQAAAAAVKGGETVGAVVATMQEISVSSKRIVDIIGVIDGIAFQTNILALNAAVEAARAGEQGRGFAVVASEVRSLAGRSADAAREIKTLIGASVERVEAGARQADEAGESMGQIVAQVQRVTQLISEISNATNEQSCGIGQVGDAVAQLDQVTQQNAALVEESAAAAESLRQQAAQLTELVAIFKTRPDAAAFETPTRERDSSGKAAPSVGPASLRQAAVRGASSHAGSATFGKSRTADAVQAGHEEWTSF